MSYCVNCGVELDVSANKCALCNTPVYNPQKKETDDERMLHPFSDNVHLPEELSPYGKKKLVLAIVTSVMIIPNIVCLLLNLTFFKGAPWSVGVLTGTLLLWSAFVLPFVTKKPHPYVIWAAISIIAVLNSFVFLWLYGELSLFLTCLIPLIGSWSLFILAYMLWYRKKRHIILKIAFVFLALAFMSLSAGLILYGSGVLAYGVQIGIICFASLLAVAGFFFYCYSSNTIRKWASKRFFL